MLLTRRVAVGIAAICLGAAAARAQTNFRGWYASGQTWLVWEDTESTPDTYRIYSSEREINDLNQANMVGRVFREDWQAARLKLVDPDLNWTIPDGAGGHYQLAGNEALFVETPHSSVPRYFAVVKDDSAEVGPENSTGPIVQSVEPIQCHLQKSGEARGHPYRILAHWIDGQTPGRPDYPVMGNRHFNGTAAVFRIWEPQMGRTPGLVPATLGLHPGGGAAFWNIVPAFLSGEPAPFHLTDGLLIAPDDNVILIRRAEGVLPERTFWFGYWEGYDRFALPEEQPVLDDALITHYTLRRLDWMMRWIIEAEGIDPARISVMGLSMGARGVSFTTRIYPEMYSAGIAFSGDIKPLEESVLQGKRSQNLRTTLPGSPTMEEAFNPAIAISTSQRDMPFTRHLVGRADFAWSAERVQQFYELLNDAAFGQHLYWDERGHTIFAPGAHWEGSPRLTAQGMTRYRSDQSFPAFFNDDQDATLEGRQPDPGDGDPAIGDPWGTWSGYYDWDLDTIDDTPSQWAATIFLISSSSFDNDVSVFDSSTADVAIRRPQNFQPAPGSVFEWTLQSLSGAKGVQTGMGIADPAGVVVIPDLTITKTPSRLTVTSTVHEITGVLDAAGFQALISPGSIVSVFGNFVETTATAGAIPLSEDLNGFSVTFNDIPGALFGVFDGAFDQSNVQVPWNVDVSSGKVEVKVHWKDDTSEVWSDPFEVDAALASPGIYMFPPGTTQAIVTNFKQAGDDVIAGSWAQPSGSIDPVTGQPAAIGGVVTLWCDGLGPVSPLPATGDIPPPGTVPVTDKIVRVFVGGVEAQVLGAVLQPTSVGLNQINIFIPEGVTPGDAVPIVIEVDCGNGKVFRSREDVTIAVRAAP